MVGIKTNALNAVCLAEFLRLAVDKISRRNDFNVGTLEIVKNVSLCNLDALVEVAAETGYIKAEDKARILKFRDNPSDEGWMRGDK